MAIGSPLISAAIERLIPLIFLAPSKPLYSALSVFLTLWAFKIMNEVRTEQPVLRCAYATVFLKANQEKLNCYLVTAVINGRSNHRPFSILKNHVVVNAIVHLCIRHEHGIKNIVQVNRSWPSLLTKSF